MYSSEGQTLATPASSAQDMGAVTPEKRWLMIAEAAYFYAEKRGFVSGNELQDWLRAEADIDLALHNQQETRQENGIPPAAQEALTLKEVFEQKREAQLKKWGAEAEKLRARAAKKKK